MCRRKPGPRCPSCQRKALASIQGRLERVAADLAEASDGRRPKLQAEAFELARQVACRRADLYATPAFQRETLAEIEHRFGQNPKDPEIGMLASQLVEGRIMDRYRREQHAAMPPLPTNAHAQTYHHQIGDARFDMAHARLRMDMASSSPAEWQEWQSRHQEAAQRAALAQARMDAVQAGGAAGWTDLSRDEQRQRRDRVAEDPMLATPVTPRRWADVVDETQDLLDGITPVREPVDDIGYQPFGDASPRRLSDDNLSGENGEDLVAGDQPSDRRVGRRAFSRGDGDSLTKQSRRRQRRRSGARTAWRSLMADRRRVNSSLAKVDSKLDDLGPKTEIDGSVFDLTFLTLITEKLGNQR